MVVQFDMAPIVDLIRQERVRAKYCTQQAKTNPDRAMADIFRTSAYWHNRTADLLEKAIPAAKGWREAP